jgi:hypothetical protein
MPSLDRSVLTAVQRMLASLKGRVDRRLALGPEPTPRPERSLQDAYASGWRDYPCVFVLSTGRGGTETLTALAALSPTIEARHEPLPRLIKASFDAYMVGGDLAGQAHWRDLVLAARDDLVRAAARMGKVYVETNNRLTYLAPVLAEVFPASRFIHVYRDPFAFVRSAMRRRYFDGHNWDFARVRPRPDDPLAERWDTLPKLECCAWLWWRTNHDVRTWMASLPESRRLTLRSEDLFVGAPQALQQWFAICDSPMPAAGRIREVLTAKLNAQRGGEFPEASGWTAEQRDCVWAYVGVLATELGYRPQPEPQGSCS